MSSRARRPGWGWTLVQVTLVAGAYVLGAELGLRLAIENRNVTPVWPPTGIAVAALLLWGGRVWPGVAIGALVANVLNGAGIEASLGIAAGNTIAPVAGTWLLRRLGFDAALARVRDALLLVFVGGLIAMTLSATGGTVTLWLTDQVGDNLVRSVWLLWWVGDAIGVVLFAPFFLLLAIPPGIALVRERPPEASAVLLFTIACATGVFGAPILIPYVAFVPVVWAALRFEQAGAACATVLITVIAVVSTAAGRGPFAIADATAGLVSLQTFNASIALTALVLAAVRTERRTALETLRSSEELYRKLFEQANDLVCIHDPDGRITFANAAAERITGYTRERLQAMTIGDLVAPEYLPIVRRMTERQLADEHEPLTYEIDVVGTTGRRVSLEINSTVVHEGADPSGVQLIGRDVTSRRLAEEQLRHRVLHDDVTELPNETLLREQLRYAVAVAEDAHSALALLVVDVDGFGELNRRIGNARGDALLRTIGADIARALRPTDAIARLRNDEFGVLLAPITSVDEAQAHASRIIASVASAIADVTSMAAEEIGASSKGRYDDMREVVERMNEPDGGTRPASASVGIVMCPGRTRDAASLVQAADLAMHAARQSGGGTFVVYGPQHDPTTVRGVVLEDDLPEAISSGALSVLYQPKIDLRTLGTAGVECLVRWEHERQGTIATDELARIAERADLAGALTTWTLKEALRRCGVWSEANLDLTVGVNVSSSELVRASFVGELRALVDQLHVSPNRLLIEVAEHDLMDGSVHGVVRSLADMGVSISVDNFGTGYSSLVQLRRLPIAEIKMDRSFVTGLVASPENREIAHSIVELAHNIGVPVVADGIETRETWTQIVELGCDYAQGPLISDAITADELEAWMRTPAWSSRVS
jgi:PAS domain S-box-containing protein/diguanylate cyclase (GGDEF)-like protein